METIHALEAWESMLQAISSQDWVACKQHAGALMAFIESDGKPPKIFASDVELPDEFVRDCIEHECTAALQLCEDHG